MPDPPILNVTVTTLTNGRVAKVVFSNLTDNDDYLIIGVNIRNIDDVRLSKDGNWVLIFQSAEIIYKLTHLVISDVNGVNPASNEQLTDLFLAMMDNCP